MSADAVRDNRTRLLIVEDQGLVRTFFERWIGTLPGCVLAGGAASGEAALALVESARPDVALVDFQLPGIDGLEFIRAARQLRPQLRALVVSSLTDPLSLTRIRESGVEGYVEKNATPEELAAAITAVATGRQYYSEAFRTTLARENLLAMSIAKILSRREQEVLGHVLAKKSNREIAELMGLSVRTVEFHRLNMMTKLDANNVTELMAKAQGRGWTSA